MAAGGGTGQPWLALAVNTYGDLSKNLSKFFAEFRVAAAQGLNLEHNPILTLVATSEDDAMAIVDSELKGADGVQAKFLIVIDGVTNSQLRPKLIKDFGRQLKVFTVFAGVASRCISHRDGADKEMEQLADRFCSLNMDSVNTKARSVRNGDAAAGSSTTSPNVPQMQERTLYPLGIKTIDELCIKLDSKEIAKGSSDLLRQLLNDNFSRRLNDPWPDIERHSKLLRVTVAAASSTQTDMAQMTHDFLLRVLDTTVVSGTVQNHILPMMWEEKKRNRAGAELVKSFIKLLQLAFEQLPTKANELVMYTQSTLGVLRDESIRTGAWWSDGLTAKVDRLEAQLNAYIKQKQQAVLVPSKKPLEKTFGPPPENFRSLSVVPVKEDMVAVGDPYLRPIKKKGRYEDSEHYLDVQFRLLREDFVRPLRDGIRQYHNGGGTGSRQANLFLYTDVRIDAPHLHKMTGEMLCTARFKAFKRTRWHKRLIGGSLVCLSYDDFHENFIFAVVADRNVDKLATGEVGLFFETPALIDHDAIYRMVESSAYFEAYQHVLRSLQAIEEDEPVPFATYLVEANTNPELPYYLRRDSLVDFSSILAEKKATPTQEITDGSSASSVPPTVAINKPHKMVDVRYMQERMTCAELGLDESQFKALQLAVTSELAVIQGPPGTGKTYVGHQIARLLLANERLWNPSKKHPMLVVCFTNHALDQFLEGIADFVKGGSNAIIRVGGRCQNERLQPFVLHNVRNSDSSGLPKELRAAHYKARDEQKKLCKGMVEDGKIIAQLATKLVKFDRLLDCIIPRHSDQFASQGQSAKAHRANIFINWLTLVASVADEVPQPALFGHKMNAPLVRELMDDGMPEFAAKNATYRTGARSQYDASRWFNEHAKDPDVNVPIREVQDWPPMQAVNQLVDMGYVDNLVVDALVDQGMDVRLALDHLQQQFGQLHVQDDVQSVEQDGPIAEQGVDDAELYDGERDDYFEEDDIVEQPKKEVHVEDMFEPTEAEWTKVGEQDDRRERTKRYLPHILMALPMKDEEADEVLDIWTLPLHRRWRLYQSWVAKLRSQYMRSLHEKEKLYGAATKRVKEIRGIADVDLLRSARVIGMTTTGAAKHQATLRAIQPRIVIMEEAAEVLEAHLVTSLTEGCEHAILIGDHKQLRPNPAVYELAKKFGLEISLFERLVNNNFPYATLTNQHRMRPEIARSLMPHFYEELQDDESVSHYPHVRGVGKDMVFINHSAPERTDAEIKSHSNQFEAEFAVHLARYLLQQSYQPQQITVLCAYMDQMLQTRKLAVKVLGANHAVRIEVVDNYQGEESDIIILSLVRSNNPDGKIGFLSVPNRVCVALSRAKIGLFCLANLDFLAKHSDLWQKIRRSLDQVGAVQRTLPVKCVMHGFEQTIATAKDFDSKCPEGGCREPCSGRLECGHICSKPCHAYDPQHESVVCTKPCARTCPSSFKHPCKKRCDQDCGDCRIMVTKELYCGHETEAPCHLELDEIACKVSCKNVLPCGHKCAARCSQPCTTSCEAIVRRKLSCGHKMDVRCFEDPRSVACTTLVSMEWPNCKHRIDVPCYTNVEKTVCPHPCNTPLPACDHLCKGTCGSCRRGRLHIRCEERCSRILVCGHECGSDCSKSCPPCKQPCETACTHSRCGRIAGEKGIKLRGSKMTENSDNKKNQGRREKGRLCGDSCPPCAEKCPNSCDHRKCDLLCFQPCAVPPCSQPCNKPLQCGTKEEPHLCIGVCGEPCPAVCRICTPEEYAQAREIFFGTEDDDDARFVRLADCGHLLEATGMDEYVRRKLEPEEETDGLPAGTEKTEIVTIDCPRCKTTIRRSARYSSTLNKRAIDIEQIKLIVRGDSKENLDLRRNEILEQLTTFISALKEGQRLGPSHTTKVITSATAMKQSIGRPNKNDLTVQSLTIWRNVVKLLGRLCQLYAEDFEEECYIMPITSISSPMLLRLTTQFLSVKPNTYLIAEWDFLLDHLTMRFDTVSETMLDQFTSEIQRLALLTEITKWMNSMARCMHDVKDDAEQLLRDILEILNGSRDIKDEVEERIRAMLQELIRKHPASGLAITFRERTQILSALGPDVTKWYKCSKGHLYGIGECGQAMQRAKCPECNEDIGGESHRLVASSQEAPEMVHDDPN
uniref:NFX1-type zinc finger-containing protein 1 n=1 Tax=Plectus sambesii TaxID=2011161 RepID=A0A914XBR8_9BILA